MSEKIKVGLIEDQALFRQGMKAVLSAWPEVEVVFESADGYSVAEKLTVTTCVPDVMLVDYSLPAYNGKEFNGSDVAAMLRERFEQVRCIILSVHNDENFIVQAIEHGAHGYLVKDCDPDELYEAIRAVATRGSYINERALSALQTKTRKKPSASTARVSLTDREVDVLRLICQQLTTEEIAEKLFISVKTVNGHRANLLEKTGMKNVAGLVIYAVRNNILDDSFG